MKSLVFALATLAIAASHQREKDCSAVKCENPTPEDCLKQNLAYVPKCPASCCARCAKPESVVKNETCKEPCSREGCVEQTIKDCKEGDVLIPADNKCYCCTTCVPGKKENSESCGRVLPARCLAKKQAFVPKGKCNKCNSCKDPKDVTAACTPTRTCPNPPTCENQHITECKPNQVLVPRNDCYCCSTCVDSTQQC